MVWHFVASWCEIQPIFAFTVKDILDTHKAIDAPKRKKKRLSKQWFSRRVGASGRVGTSREQWPQSCKNYSGYQISRIHTNQN